MQTFRIFWEFPKNVFKCLLSGENQGICNLSNLEYWESFPPPIRPKIFEKISFEFFLFITKDVFKRLHYWEAKWKKKLLFVRHCKKKTYASPIRHNEKIRGVENDEIPFVNSNQKAIFLWIINQIVLEEKRNSNI